MKVRNYALVTGSYWAFTVTDGALRMLVLLHFHDLGYSPVRIAMLFVLYELMGVVTNLFGGWAGSAHGLNHTLRLGLGLQVAALVALSFQDSSWSETASVAFVVCIQAFSGVAKDLTKMSSKSAVKVLAKDTSGAESSASAAEARLFRWVAALTGSKNALKGVGFFVGASLLSALGFSNALRVLATLAGFALALVLLLLDEELGRAKQKPRLSKVLSKSDSINRLSAARFFLFGARDVWFVVALPVFLSEQLGWSFTSVGAFLALWVIGYGVLQTLAPTLLSAIWGAGSEAQRAKAWGLGLSALTAALAAGVSIWPTSGPLVVGGLLAFGAVFAVNSSLHSYLILAYANDESVAMDVGFYYSANAAGRLVGTIVSGLAFWLGGLDTALAISALSLFGAWGLLRPLPEPSA